MADDANHVDQFEREGVVHLGAQPSIGAGLACATSVIGRYPGSCSDPSSTSARRGPSQGS
jgi:hypothetical protein